MNTVEELIKDVKQSGFARRGVPKTVGHFEVPITYLRINKELRLIYHIIRDGDNEGNAEILLLDIATKKQNDFQEKASRVSEHLVHGRAIDELTRHVVDDWDEEEKLTLERIRELNNEERSKSLYKRNESDWDEERFQERLRRAAIFQSSNSDQLILNENGKLVSQLKLQGQQNDFRYSDRLFWLLDGVAGTGKTTVLLYRFCDHFYKFLGHTDLKKRIQFVTHNPLLKEEMIQQLSEIIPDPEVRNHAETCIITLKEFFDLILKEAIIATIRQQLKENIDRFLGKEKTKELHFTIVYSKKKTTIPSEMSIIRIEAFQGNFEAFIPRGRWKERIPSDSHILVQSSLTVQKMKNRQGEENSDVIFNEQLTQEIDKLSWIDLVFPEKKRFDRTKYQLCLERLNERDLDNDLYFEEFRGIIRGYNSSQVEQILTLEEYQKIGAKRARIDKSLRPEIYNISKRVLALWEKDERWGRQQGGWDNLDIRRVLEKIQARTEISSLDAIFIDEVQDLSHCDMYTVLNRLDKGGRLSATGDLAQSVQPSSFTWNDLRAQITDIHGERPEKEFEMAENFRSTPNLVEVANKILELQQDVRGVSKNDLQKPYATSQGDQVLVFKRNQEDIFSILEKYSLPNTSCPLLVRDNGTKEYLKTKFSESNIDFIFTISEFKGMEKTSVLLYDIASGSSRFLDRYFNEIRGKEAQKREYGKNTALLELRHVFVGMTRARFQMGLLTPSNHSEFIDHLITITDKSYLNSDVDDSRIEAFKRDGLTPEEYVEQAKIYERRRLYDAAASNWENAKREADALRCRSMNKDGGFKDYNKAIQAIGKAIDEGIHESEKWPQFWSNIKDELPEMGSEYSDPIYDIAIRIGDRKGLLQSRATELEALKDYENAYKFYLDIEDEEKANEVFQKLKPTKQIALLISPEIGEEDRARALFWELIYDGKYPKDTDDNAAYFLISKDRNVIEEYSRIYGFDLAPENQDIDFEKFYSWAEGGRSRFRSKIEKLQLEYLEKKGNKSNNEYQDLFELAKKHKRLEIIRKIAKLKSDLPVKKEVKEYLDEKDPETQIKKIIDSDDPISEEIEYNAIFNDVFDSVDIMRSLNKRTRIDYIKKIQYTKNEDIERFNLLIFVSLFFDKKGGIVSNDGTIKEIMEETITDSSKYGLWRFIHEFTNFSRKNSGNLVNVGSRDITLWRYTFRNNNPLPNTLEYLAKKNGKVLVYLIAIYVFANRIVGQPAGEIVTGTIGRDIEEARRTFVFFCWRFGFISKEDTTWKMNKNESTERARELLLLDENEAYDFEKYPPNLLKDLRKFKKTTYEEMNFQFAEKHHDIVKENTATSWEQKDRDVIGKLLPEFIFKKKPSRNRRGKNRRTKIRAEHARKTTKSNEIVEEEESDLDLASVLQNLENTSEIETTTDYRMDVRLIIEEAVEKVLSKPSDDPHDELEKLIVDFVKKQPVDLLARLDVLALEMIHCLSEKFSQKEYLVASIAYASILSPNFMRSIEINEEQYQTLSSSKDFTAIKQLIGTNVMPIQITTPPGWKKIREKIV